MRSEYGVWGDLPAVTLQLARHRSVRNLLCTTISQIQGELHIILTKKHLRRDLYPSLKMSNIIIQTHQTHKCI